MGKTVRRSKCFALFLCFIFIFEFLVFNSNINVKEARAQERATILDINSIRLVNFDLSIRNQEAIFDFNNFLGSGDKIEEFKLKKVEGSKKTDIATSAVDDTKRKWKAKFIPINGDTYFIEMLANISGSQKKLIQEVFYNDWSYGKDPVFKYTQKNNKHIAEAELNHSFIDSFNDNEMATIRFAGFPVINKTIKEIKDAKYKISVEDERDKWGNDNGFNFYFDILGRRYDWKLFVTTTNGKKDFGIVIVDLESAEFNSNNPDNVDVKLKFKEQTTLKDRTFNTNDVFRFPTSSLSSIRGTYNTTKKDATFEDVGFSLGGRFTTRIDPHDTTKQKLEGRCSLFVPGEMEKLNCDIRSVTGEGNIVNVDLEPMKAFIPKVDPKNKLYIYELSDSYSKGTKLGEKTSGVGWQDFNEIRLSKKFEKGKGYLVEFTNGTKTISTSFVYTPMEFTASDMTETSVKLNWVYPNGYRAVSGDRVEIFLRDKGSNGTFPVTPKKTLSHGSSSVNLSNTTSTVVTGIAPGTNYEAKIVLYNQRGVTDSFVDFTTRPFVLKNFIEVEGAQYKDSFYSEALSRNRRIAVTWDFEPQNMQFSEGDKVEIFLKPTGSGAFSGYPMNNEYYSNPAFTATQNLNNIKRAEITIPSWGKNYHVDLIYTIGGKKILTSKPSGINGEDAYNRRTVHAAPGSPTLEITDITQTSSKIKWKVDTKNDDDGEYESYRPEEGHLVRFHLKKVPSTSAATNSFDDDMKIKEFVYGTDWNYTEEYQEFDLTDLEPDQWYRMRIQHVVQKDGEFGEDGEKYFSNFYNFKTSAFTISTLTAENQTDDASKVKLKWETEGSVDFGSEDKLEVFLKESTSSEYPETPISGLNLTPGTSKEAIIEVPNFNTLYNAKVEYTLKGKKISKYVLVQVNAELRVEVSDIKSGTSRNSNNWTAKVKWTYPNGYKPETRLNDKIKLTVTKQENSSRTSGLPNNEEIAVTTSEKEITGLEENAVYDVTLKFLNGENKTEVYTVSTSFKATNDLQIVGLNTSNVKTKTGTINWSFSPTEKEFSNGDKVEVFIKENSPKKSRAGDDLTNFTKIYTMNHGNSSRSVDEDIVALSADLTHSQHVEKTGPIKDFKSLNLKDLGVNKEYILKVKYTMNEVSSISEQEINAQSGTPKTSEAEVVLKTKVDELKATVYVSNQTSATFGWEYPQEYELQEGDKIEIFVKEIKEEGSQTRDSGISTEYSNPLLTLTHAADQNPEQGKYNMNEVTAVDVSGLTPERKYKSKIKFTMGTGDDNYSIEKEVDISTKSFEIKSFEMDSYQEYDILVNWAIEPEGMTFNPADTLKIFVKLASEDAYPNEPEYSLSYEENAAGKSINNTFSDYVLAKSLGVDQKMKLEYKVGERIYEKELEFNNKINPIKAEATEVNETRALVSITLPDNYEFVNGDKMLIYAKDEFSDGDVINDYNLVFEGVQSDNNNISDMTLIELSYLLPEARYDVAVALDLEDGQVEPVTFDFTTGALTLSDIKLEQLKYNDALISWNYGKNKVDFFEDSDYSITDKLIIAHKESDGTPMPDDINLLKELSNTEYLGDKISSVCDASIKIEDPTKDYDVAVCYDLGGLLYMKTFKTSYLSASIDESQITKDGAKITWKYPSNITFGDSDKTEVFVRRTDETNYPDSPSLTSSGSGTTSGELTGLEGGVSYTVKVQITKEGIQIDPFEVTFETEKAFEEEIIIEEIPSDIQGTSAEFTIPVDLPVDIGGTIALSMGDEAYQGFTATFNEDGSGFTISPTIPKKKYTNIELEIPLEDGSTHKIVIPEFTTQPEDVAQDWLSNAYWFAFERFPDEEGYNYWYAHRMKPKTLNGEYFLKNLMFAEDEFTNRNLSDNDLIAALYQIVVNREYDQGGLEFWIGIYNENLQNAQGNKKLAQEVLVDRMVHEPEFGKLCDKVGIFWRQQDQDAAGVIA